MHTNNRQFTPEQRDRSIQEHLPMVRFAVSGIVGGNPPQGFDFEDLVGHGIIGLVQAVDRYDDSYGVPFGGFAMSRIRGAVFDAMRAIDPIGRSTRSLAKRFEVAASRLALELGREPTAQEIQLAAGVSASQFWKARAVANMSVVPFDNAPDGELSWADKVSDGAPPISAQIEQRELSAALSTAIAGLPSRDQQILSLYYVEGLTMREVAIILDISQTRVSQLLERAQSRLRANPELAAAA